MLVNYLHFYRMFCLVNKRLSIIIVRFDIRRAKAQQPETSIAQNV